MFKYLLFSLTEEEANGAEPSETGSLLGNDEEAGNDGNKSGEKKKSSGRKEKSVLQAKLSKLAVQIGYFGQFHNTLIFYELFI